MHSFEPLPSGPKLSKQDRSSLDGWLFSDNFLVSFVLTFITTLKVSRKYFQKFDVDAYGWKLIKVKLALVDLFVKLIIEMKLLECTIFKMEQFVCAANKGKCVKSVKVNLV